MSINTLYVVLLLIVLVPLFAHFWVGGRKAKAFVRKIRAGEEPNFALLAEVGQSDRVSALVEAIRWLQLEDRYATAQVAIDELRKLRPAQADEALSRQEIQPSEDGSKLALKRLAAQPRSTELRVEVAQTVAAVQGIEAGLAILDAAPTQSADIDLKAAQWHYEQGADETAVLLIGRIEDAISTAMMRDRYYGQYWANVLQGAKALKSRVLSDRSAVDNLRDDVTNHQLYAWKNHWNLAVAIATDAAEPQEVVAPFRNVDDMYADGLRALEETPRDVLALCDLGIVGLRTGDNDNAKSQFERAVSLDGTSYPARLGMAAAMRGKQLNLARRARRIIEAKMGEEYADWLDGWDALSALERRVCCAAIRPMASRRSVESPAIQVVPYQAFPVDEVGYVGEADLLDTVEWPFAIGVAEVAYESLTYEELLALTTLLQAVSMDESQYGPLGLEDIRELFVRAYRDWLQEHLFADASISMHVPLRDWFDSLVDELPTA